MDGPIVQKDPKIRIILIHITDTRRADSIIPIVRDFAVPSRGWSGAVWRERSRAGARRSGRCAERRGGRAGGKAARLQSAGPSQAHDNYRVVLKGDQWWLCSRLQTGSTHLVWRSTRSALSRTTLIQVSCAI